MKKTKLPALLVVLATIILTVSAMAQTPAAPSPQSDPSAQSEASAPAEHDAKTTDTSGGDMPNTASPLALVALMGAGSLGAGFAARRFAKRYGER